MNEMLKDFENLFWHDALLRSFKIIKGKENSLDILELFLEWPDESLFVCSKVSFINSIKINLQLNFDFSQEVVYSASWINISKEMENFKINKSMNSKEYTEIVHFHIELNSGSQIDVLCNQLKIESLG